MPFRTAARLALLIATVATLYLALTPGPAGVIIADGTARHMLAFIVLPWLTMAAYPQVSSWWIFLVWAVFGGAIELAQLGMAVGRVGSWSDWLLDMATAAGAILVASLARRLYRRAGVGSPARGSV